MYLLRQMTRVEVGGTCEAAAGLLQGLLLLAESRATVVVSASIPASVTASEEAFAFFRVMMKMFTRIQLYWPKKFQVHDVARR